MSIAVIHSNENSKKYTKDFAVSPSVDIQRRHVIKRKVIAIGKLSKSYNVLKEHSELVQQLKALSNGKLPVGILAMGEQGIREAIIQKTTANALNKPTTTNDDLDKIKEEKDNNAVLYYPQPALNKIISREGGHV
ncbi:MAG: hypothetical protein EXX96DRAFT_608669 [Benjaminiella poitrasii]|nr:MAG: hypothetical protein EXX96DRAFT_608669 [Benjaminiella poitrasii]